MGALSQHPQNSDPRKVALSGDGKRIDRKEARRHLAAIAPGEQSFTFQTFDDDDDRKSPKLIRVLIGTLDQHADELERLNSRGAGIFAMLNRGDGKGRSNDTVAEVRCLFLDTDGAPLLDEYPLDPHVITVSSPGKFHVTWRVEGVPLEAFKPLQKGLAAIHGTDSSVCDLARVVRLAGTYHRKATPHMVTIQQADFHAPPYTLKAVELAWPKLKEQPTKKQPTKASQHAVVTQSSYTPSLLGIRGPAQDKVREKLAALCDKVSQLEEGGRNNEILKVGHLLGGYIAHGDIDEAEVRSKLLDAVLECGLSRTEAEEVINNGITHGKLSPLTIDLLEYAQTDYGNAERLAALHGDEFRYCHGLGFLVWDGKCWQKDGEGNFMVRKALTAARQLTARAAALTDEEKYSRPEWLKYAISCERHTMLKNAIELSKSIPGISIQPSQLDADPMKLNIANGTLNLTTGKLEKHRPADLITKLAPVVYDPAAICPKWLEFQQTICGGDADLLGFKQRGYGYTLTGRMDEQVLFILYGSGANGKSTEIDVVRHILGQYANTAQFDTFQQKTGEAIRSDIADLVGARFVPASEGESRARLAEGLVKQLTGGDEVKARFLHKDFFRFVPTFKIWLATNHKPNITGTDNGIWRRIRLVPYAITIPPEQQNKKLPDDLKAEASGILNWLLDGVRDWLEQGLGHAQAVQDATESYRQESDVLADFIAARCVTDPHAVERAGDLYNAYMTWCEDGGDKPFSSTLFGRMLNERGYTSQSARIGNKVVKVRQGICLSENVKKGVVTGLGL